MTLQDMQERLVSWASDEPRKPALLEARRVYFESHGEPHEEDKSFETRMNALVDFYLYDFRPDGGAHTVLDLFLREAGRELPGEILEAYRQLGRSIHSLFEVRRLKPGGLVLRDVFSRQSHDVSERRQMPGLARGDLIEARLLRHGERLHLSGAFLYHPPEARRAILAEVKRLRKAAGRRGRPDVEGFLARLSRMAFKMERYRNVKVESIYDFSPPPPRPDRT